MEDDQPKGFSWRTLFFVTGFSAFAFSGILKFLDGSYSNLFLWIGISGLMLGLLGQGIKMLGENLTAGNS